MDIFGYNDCTTVAHVLKTEPEDLARDVSGAKKSFARDVCKEVKAKFGTPPPAAGPTGGAGQAGADWYACAVSCFEFLHISHMWHICFSGLGMLWQSTSE